MTQLEKDRQAFMAQYWDQEVGYNDLVREFNNYVSFHTIVGVNYYLSLYSLEDITDEDLKEVAKICGYNFSFVFRDVQGEVYVGKSKKPKSEKYYRDELIRITFSGWIEYDENVPYDGTYRSVPVGVFDFLRSMSYLLPFRGYSVERILEMGWTKIRKR